MLYPYKKCISATSAAILSFDICSLNLGVSLRTLARRWLTWRFS